MRKRKILKVVGLSTVIVGTCLVLFVAAFVYNPFEGTLRDMRDVVPRNVDFFVRKANLAEDFTTFPEPVFWAELEAMPPWQELKQGPAARSLNAGGAIERAVEDLRRVSAELRQVPVLSPDLLHDVLGSEVILAGRLKPPAVDQASWCAWLRVSWKVRFAMGALRYDFVQQGVRDGGTQIRAEGDTFVVQPPGSTQPLFVARYLDCLLVANDRALLDSSLELARGFSEQDAFGPSGEYRDGIESRLHEWEKTTGVPQANAVEFYLRPDQLYPLVSFDDNWPDPRDQDDINERVLASFVNLQGWRFLLGALVFEPKSLSLLAHIDLNRNKHTPFQAHFFQAEAQPRDQWLDPFMSMVPQSACAAIGMRMPAGEFLHTMYGALDQATKELIQEALQKTGQYRSVGELIEKVQTALLPRLGFVFRKNVPDQEIPVLAESPMPQIAWVFWVRPKMRQVLDDFVGMLNRYRETLKFQRAYQLPILGQKGDVILEFTSPQIPATGEVAFLVFDEFFLVSNSGPLIKSMVHARFDMNNVRSVLRNDDLQEYYRELPQSVNGFVYVQGQQMRLLLGDYEKALEKGMGDIDPAWATAHRPQAENEVFRAKYASRYAAQAALQGPDKKQFSNEVDDYLAEMWTKQASSYTAGDRAELRQAMAVCDMMRSAYLQVVLDPQSIKATARVKLN